MSDLDPAAIMAEHRHLGCVAWPCETYRLASALADRDAKIAALTSALQRTESNFRAAVNGRPVRDMAENLAENRRALGEGAGS